jgi:hypothetical protein
VELFAEAILPQKPEVAYKDKGVELSTLEERWSYPLQKRAAAS